jgi:hypothetical protein
MVRVFKILFPILVFAFLVWVDFKYYGPRVVGELNEQQIQAAIAEAARLNAAGDFTGYGQEGKFLGLYQGKRLIRSYICFGDICPGNGGYYVLYSDFKDETSCLAGGGEPVIGYGWGRVYGGCAPKLESASSTAPSSFLTTKGQANIIELVHPLPGQKVSSPLTVTGRARGTWFFEGSFPVILANWDGLIISQVPAQAQGEWMTEEFVPFSATLTFDQQQVYDRGSLILKKDNPSGLPEYDDALEIPVTIELEK